MPRLYLQLSKFNPHTIQALRDLHNELPDRLNVYDGDDAGTHRAWVFYPAGLGEPTVRSAVRQALTTLGVAGIDIA